MSNRFIRWQSRTIDQLGNVINLILGLSTAIMGYMINAIAKSDLLLFCWDKFFYILCLFFTFFSIALSIMTNLNRLQDFRITTRIVRKKEKGEREIDLKADRDKSDSLGKRTWCLFYILIVFFCLSIIMAAIFFLRIYSNKIF